MCVNVCVFIYIYIYIYAIFFLMWNCLLPDSSIHGSAAARLVVVHRLRDPWLHEVLCALGSLLGHPPLVMHSDQGGALIGCQCKSPLHCFVHKVCTYVLYIYVCIKSKAFSEREPNSFIKTSCSIIYN